MGKEGKTTTRSIRAFDEACKYLPGGVNSPVRAFRGVEGKPIFISAAKGSKVYDIDGNEYIDYVCSWGPVILGHSHPKVVSAIIKAAKKGTSFGAPTSAETELAKKIVSAFPSIKKIRLVSSGTEAVMTAIRLARGYTERDLIIKMSGCYHGHSDSLLVSAGSGLAEQSRPTSAGIPQEIAKMTVVVPYNDIEAVKSALQKHKKKIAAILIEPVAANMGVVPPVYGYLNQLRQLCDSEGSVLIFDEVITGFRIAAGGAQDLYGTKADITCLGKIIGGGLPLAAVGGHGNVMDMLAPDGPVYQAGTLSGNPIATAAAIATLDVLLSKRDVYKKLESISSLLEKGLLEAAKEANIPVTINRVGSIMSIFFIDKPVRNFTDVQTTNIRQFKKFFTEMLKSGIYLPPSPFEAMFVSLAHSEKDIKKTINSAAFFSLKEK